MHPKPTLERFRLFCRLGVVLSPSTARDFDRLAKSPEFAITVIPANAGIQYFHWVLDAGVRRHDAFATFYRFINYDGLVKKGLSPDT